MVQKSVLISGIITAVICLALFITSIFFLDDLLEYNNKDELTNINLNEMVYNTDNLKYGLMCYGYIFEIYTGFNCEQFLTDNIDNNNITYVNNEKLNNYNLNQVVNFCKFFKNNNICNYA